MVPFADNPDDQYPDGFPSSGRRGNSPDLTVLELARQVSQALARVERIATRFETEFVRKDIFDLTLKGLNDNLISLSKKIDDLDLLQDKRLLKIEDNGIWFQRLVYGTLATAAIGTFVGVSQFLGN